MGTLKSAVILSFLGLSSAFLEPASTTIGYFRSTTPSFHRKYVTEQGYFGSFSSENYPGNYPNNGYYVYDVGTNYYMPTRLKFKSFSVEYCPGCSCDNVTITPRNPQEQPLVFCGSTLPNGNGILDFSSPVTLTFMTNFVYSSSGFEVSYELGQQPSSSPYYPTSYTTMPPASRCPSEVCAMCAHGYYHKMIYTGNCPECRCVQTTTTEIPPTSRCPPAICPTCVPGYENKMIYTGNCPECTCVRTTTTDMPLTSKCPPATCASCAPGYVNHVTYRYGSCPVCECIYRGSTAVMASTCPPPVCPTCPWGYYSRIDYQYYCPRCECVHEATTVMTLPPQSAVTYPVPASTYPPSRSILSELFRIHNELSDLQDNAKRIDNDVINLIQRIEGNNVRQRSVVLEALGKPLEQEKYDDKTSENQSDIVKTSENQSDADNKKA